MGRMGALTICQNSARVNGFLGQDSPRTAWGWNPQPRFNTKGLLANGLTTLDSRHAQTILQIWHDRPKLNLRKYRGTTVFPATSSCHIAYKKEPRCRVNYNGANTWQRPTLTGPIVPLPSALRRFTSGFGMGPGGSTSLWSPEGNLGLARVNEFNAKLNL